MSWRACFLSVKPAMMNPIAIDRGSGARALPAQYPLLRDGQLTGIVDLLSQRTWMFDGSAKEALAAALEVPENARDEVGVLRRDLLEALAEFDDEVLAQLIEQQREPDAAALHRALRRAVVSGALVPVYCGIASRNQGIQPLLDAIVENLPSPLDVPPVRGTHPDTGAAVERKPVMDEPLALLVFKLQAQTHGEIAFVRVYSGRLTTNQGLWNPRARSMERAGRVLRMHANHGEALDSAGPGDIVALTGLKHSATGDTLCDRESPIVLERPAFPEPVITLVVEPASADEREKLRLALARLAHEDPTFHVREDPDTGQWTIAGMGELHLEVARHRLAHEFHVVARVGQPRVAYREAVQQRGRGLARVERQLGGQDVFGEVELEIVPDPALTAPVVEWEPRLPIPPALRGPIESTLLLDTQSGPRFGYPLVRVRLRVVGGGSDPKRDAELAFTQAANQALKSALDAAQVVLLEPLMAFEIQTPAEFASGILADLGSRKAEVTDVQADGALRAIHGTVPLSQMFGYSTAVRSLSQGRAGFSMSPAGYRAVPEAELAARGLVWN